MTETFEKKTRLLLRWEEIPEKIHTVLRWHVSDITFSDNYVNSSDLYVDPSDIYVDLSDHYVDLSEKNTQN